MTVPVLIKERSAFRSVLRTMALALLGILIAATPMLAQGLVRAGISGVLSDESGAILPGVTATITNLVTNQSRTAVTGERGVYRFAGVWPGLR